MDYPVWGLLEKSQVDNEKIEDAITRLVGVHESDPDSHLGVGESLQSHKASEIIDHVARSIVADKLHNSAKPNEAYVSADEGDYATIQAAIDDGKKVIFVKAGTYEITTPITIAQSDFYLIGEGRDKTIIKLAAGTLSAATPLIKVGNGSGSFYNINIVGLVLDGNKANVSNPDEYAAHGIEVTSFVYYSFFTDNYIHDCLSSGIDFQGAYSEISHNRITYCDHQGLYVHGTFSTEALFNFIYGNYLKGHGDRAIYIAACIENVILANRIADNLSGPAIDSSANLISIQNNMIYNCLGGIKLYSARCSVVSNQIYHSTSYGISVDTSEGSVVNSNLIVDSQNSGIYLIQARRCSITGNKIIENHYHGIHIKQSWNNTIVGNILRDNSQQTNNTYCHIFLEGVVAGVYCVRNIINANNMLGDAANKPAYCIYENDSNCDYNIYTSNVCIQAVSGQISIQGDNNLADNNIVA